MQMKWFFLLLALVSGTELLAEKGVISGVVKDATTGETLIGANVLIGEGIGVSTDFDGQYRIEAEYGKYTLKVSYIGFETITKEIELNSKSLRVDFKMETITLDEVKITSDIARDRETPVAFTNVLPAQIQEELASQDLPMVLNATPGVYATQQGGGDGDARITIRGFNQRNVAVMLDGVPVNDMENGWVFWSNWFGLDAVTRSIQVQRGLGASKIAIPSVGGTMNILTKGIDQKKGGSVKQEIGNNGFLRTTVGLNSGQMKNGWGVTAAASFKRGDGWVDQAYTEGYFYFLKVQKRVGGHIISLSGMGAPQEHGQRSFKRLIADFDKDFAYNLFEGSDEVYNLFTQYHQDNDFSKDSLYSVLEGQGISRSKADDLLRNYADTTGADDRGLRYNQYWGNLERYEINDNGDTIRADKETLVERRNFYHKPQFALRDFWTVNEKLYISNTAYLSIGKGGGSAATPSINEQDFDENGQADFQKIYDANRFGPFNIDPSIHPTERKSGRIIRNSINNHFWYGLISSATYVLNDRFTLAAGLDFRSYRGQHYREVDDLLGGDYFVDEANENQSSRVKRKGDRINYHNDGIVRWGGSFAQLEVKEGNWSAFINVSGAYSGYKRVDYFRNKDLIIDGETFREAIGYGDVFYTNGSQNLIAFNGATVTNSGDTVFVDNVSQSAEDGFIVNPDAYTIESSEARHTESEWKWIPGYTIKGGANYNLNEWQNVFVNLGYISKAQRFNNVIDNSNQFFKEIENEKIQALEFGYAITKKSFAVNLNTYYTVWENRPAENGVVVSIDDETFRANINGMDARHMGVELDFIYKVRQNLDLEGLVSLGDWTWQSADTVRVFDDNLDEIYKQAFDAKGVHVGDAAQTQLGGSMRYEPIKGLYFKSRITYFARNFADFDPLSLDPVNNPESFDQDGNPLESWLMPDYYLVDFHSGYRFKYEWLRFDLRLSILNVMDKRYISDAQNNDGFATDNVDFNANSASVFFGQGRRFNTSLRISF